jgi:dUTP pyrophosphatase
LPEGYEAQIRSRSGLAAKSGVFVLNSPGTVDSSYRGEICVVLMNTSDRGIWINNGDRIAQMVINKIELWPPVVVEELDSTDRGEGGFGSTGK